MTGGLPRTPFGGGGWDKAMSREEGWRREMGAEGEREPWKVFCFRG